jgi:hypothetical protein
MISLVFCTVYFVCSLFHGGLLPGEIRDQKPEQLLSTPVDFTGSYITDKKDAKPVSGKAVFSVDEFLADFSIIGTLTLSLSEQTRKDIASLTSKPVSDIPVSLEVKDTITFLSKKSMCPPISLSPKLHDISFFDGEFHLAPFIISIDLGNNSRELSILVCTWERLAKREDGHTYRVGNKINKLLKGRKDE